jgi:hypothetical protein
VKTKYEGGMNFIAGFAVIGFLVGAIPLLAFTFFSPGLQSESPSGILAFIFGVVTYALLVVAARKRKALWGLVIIQTLLLAGVLIETFSDSALYVGT